MAAVPAPAPRSSWAADLPASLVVFLVALPLSLGIASASGATPQSGLIAAAIGGIVVGLFGGAPLQVSGPAAGLTVMVAADVEKFGLASLGIIVVVAGALQVLGGALRLARGALAISPAVLHAMLAGIGILIALGQMHVLLGDTPSGSAVENLLSLPESFATLNTNALAIGGASLAVLLLWPRVEKKVRWLPGSLLAIVVGTLVSMLLPGEVARVTIHGNLFDAMHLPLFGKHALEDLVLAGLALAIVASAESLLCAVATDQLHSGPRADLDRELLAQGLGNVTCGLVGGLPITGVIVRSSANIAAGARTKWSATLHGVWMAAFVLLCSELLGKVPMAALAALLVHVGVKLVKIREIRRAAAYGDAVVYWVTIFGVVFLGLLWGIGIGFTLALGRLLKRFAAVDVVRTENADGSFDLRIRGDLNFLVVPALVAQLRQVPPRRIVHVHFELAGLDHAAVDAIRGWRVGYEREGGKVHKPCLDDAWRTLR